MSVFKFFDAILIIILIIILIYLLFELKTEIPKINKPKKRKFILY